MIEGDAHLSERPLVFKDLHQREQAPAPFAFPGSQAQQACQRAQLVRPSVHWKTKLENLKFKSLLCER